MIKFGVIEKNEADDIGAIYLESNEISTQPTVLDFNNVCASIILSDKGKNEDIKKPNKIELMFNSLSTNDKTC